MTPWNPYLTPSGRSEVILPLEVSNIWEHVCVENLEKKKQMLFPDMSSILICFVPFLRARWQTG